MSQQDIDTVSFVFWPLVLAVLFVLRRVDTVPGAWLILTKQLKPGANFDFQKSWVANLTLVTTLLAVLVKSFDANPGHIWTALSFLFAALLALAILTYVGGNGTVWVFLLADLISIWSVLGASLALIFAVFALSWFPWLVQIMVAGSVLISLIEVCVFANRTMGALLQGVASQRTETDAVMRETVSWTMR